MSGLDRKYTGEQKAHIVIAITAAMMLLEISAGIAFGSMALLADGIHMASHAVALGKVNALGGYTGAILLGIVACMMAWESTARFFQPVEIAFNQAIVVAVLGLVVNGVSALILGDHGHAHGHSHHDADGEHHHHGHHHDHNRRAAYFHVLADAAQRIRDVLDTTAHIEVFDLHV